MKSKRVSLMSLMTAALALALTPGCHHDQTSNVSSVPEISETQRLENTQSAAGARADGTLYADHFDSDGLSSLGTNKLDRMLADDHKANPMVVYLDIPSDDSLIAGRKQAVTQYLTDHGLTAAQIDIQVGPNPGTSHQSAPDIANYSKTDTAADAGGDSGSSSSSAGH